MSNHDGGPQRVTVPRGFRWPNVCACCLGPADTAFPLEREGPLFVYKASVPSCRGCLATYRSWRRVFLTSWVITVLVLAIACVLILPSDISDLAGLAMIPLSLPLAFPLTRLFWSSGKGHIRGCAMARLASKIDTEFTVLLRNPEYARMVREAAR